ncbi:galactose oxidase [Hesseltinella vesiculosa]|uniref:Galactose oxidase n=1 Tax=Hesseltinella vesiculosa TaxID=101127 RepID=A0A1X2GU65_9FUNG|nr:galactose oxidase [Hesseltinella vesiculosa]
MSLLKKWSMRSTKKPQKRYPWSQSRLRHAQRLLPRHGFACSVHRSYGIIVFGGAYKPPFKKDLVMIDPESLNVRLVATSGTKPAPRVYCTTVLYGDYLFMYGGQLLDPNLPGDANLYILNLGNQCWTMTGSLQGIGSRSGHTMVVHQGMAYIWGGCRPNGALLKDLCVYSLHKGLQGDWQCLDLEHGPTARSHHTALTLDGKMYIFGGNNGERCFNDLWCYDMMQQSWSLIEAMGYIPCPRSHTSSVIIDGVIYVFGGKSQDGTDLNDLYGYRINDRCWFMFQNMGQAPSPRHDHALAVLGHRICVIGGNAPTESKSDLDLVHILDHDIITYPPASDVPSVVPRASTSLPLAPRQKHHLSTSTRSTTSLSTQLSSHTHTHSQRLPARTHSLRAAARLTSSPSSQPSLRLRREPMSPLQQLIDDTNNSLRQARSDTSSPHPLLNDDDQPTAPPSIHSDTAPPVSSPLPATHPPEPAQEVQLEPPSSGSCPPPSSPAPTGLLVYDVPDKKKVVHRHHQHGQQSLIPIAELDQPSTTDAELLDQIEQRDNVIRSMKNMELWWRTRVAKARGLPLPLLSPLDLAKHGDAGLLTSTSTDLIAASASVSELQLPRHSLPEKHPDLLHDDDIPADIHLLAFPDDATPGQNKRLFFENLITAKSEARRIRHDIYLTAKPISAKLDLDHQICQAALEEASHYKTLCAALLFNQPSQSGHPARDLSPGAVDLLEQELGHRMTRLEQKLQTILELNIYTSEHLAQYRDQADASHRMKTTLNRQLEHVHQKAVQYHDMYEALLKQMVSLQRSTMSYHFQTVRNKYELQLLEQQVTSMKQINPLNLITLAPPVKTAPTWDDVLRHWLAKNKNQQLTNDQLREQLLVSSELTHQLRLDLLRKTNDWRSTLVNLEKTKLAIRHLKRATQ